MSKRKQIIRTISLIVVVIIIGGLAVAYHFYNKIYANNVSENLKTPYYLYIGNHNNYSDVIDSLKASDVLVDLEAFKWVSQKKNYPNKIKSGRYEIKPGMNNNQIINMLRSGNQKPIKLTFNSIRTKYELAKKISDQMEFDSLTLIHLLNDGSFVKKYGFNPETVIGMFIPNTYEFYWNKSPESFIEKMYNEYQKFWNKDRLEKLKKLHMSKLQVSTLASIVQAEQSVHNEEKPKVAGVYINRLQKEMHLESCPTVIYAMGDFSRRRLLNRDLEFESPYNTYKYAGLPPAPINLPEISSIDAVLNYEKHNYIFFCAKDDFSGYHYFSTNLTQHNIYARRYQLALNKRDIKH